MAVSPRGTSETWRTCLQVRSTLFPPSLQYRVYFWLVFFAALIEFLYNALSSFFFSPIFIIRTFLCCCGAVFKSAEDFNGDLSTWEVGKVTEMQRSTCSLFFPQDWAFLWLFSSCFFCVSLTRGQHPFLFFQKCFKTAVSHEHCAVANGKFC